MIPHFSILNSQFSIRPMPSLLTLAAAIVLASLLPVEPGMKLMVLGLGILAALLLPLLKARPMQTAPLPATIGAPRRDTSVMVLALLGVVLLGMGIIAIFATLHEDVSVSTSAGRVDNLGLMHQQSLHFTGSLALLLAGLALVVTSAVKRR